MDTKQAMYEAWDAKSFECELQLLSLSSSIVYNVNCLEYTFVLQFSAQKVGTFVEQGECMRVRQCLRISTFLYFFDIYCHEWWVAPAIL